MSSELLVVGISGFFGSITRYCVYLFYAGRDMRSFPWGTLTVNVLGCLLIGLIAAFIERSGSPHRTLYLIGSVGFLGAFTTFSAFGLETVNLMRTQQMNLAALNIIANLVLGFGAVYIGRGLAAYL